MLKLINEALGLLLLVTLLSGFLCRLMVMLIPCFIVFAVHSLLTLKAFISNYNVHHLKIH
uniref:Uncharacterized protein n=1 Tax=Tetranychus urticae TaxID=32264 RepID=T1JTT0_TETUR